MSADSGRRQRQLNFKKAFEALEAQGRGLLCHSPTVLRLRRLPFERRLYENSFWGVEGGERV